MPFAGALTAEGLPLVALALLIAVGLGAWHALLPGHGKTIMAAAMVGSGARARQAISVAGAVALMHSASVLALGLAVLALERTFRPETIYPWLGALAGLAAVAVGAYLLRVRWGAWRHHRAHRATEDEHRSTGRPSTTTMEPRLMGILTPTRTTSRSIRPGGSERRGSSPWPSPGASSRRPAPSS